MLEAAAQLVESASCVTFDSAERPAGALRDPGPGEVLVVRQPQYPLLRCGQPGQFVHRPEPAAVVLWAQARSTASLPSARHLADTRWGVKGARRQPSVVLAGPGWSGPSARGAVRPATLEDAVDIVSGVYAEGY